MDQITLDAFPAYSFTPGCDYTFTYSAIVIESGDQPLSSAPAIQFNDQTRVFTITSTNSDHKGIFQIEVKALLNNLAGTHDRTLTF